MCIQFSEEVCFPSSFRFSMSMFTVKYSTFRLFLHTLPPRAPEPSVSAMQGYIEEPQSDSSYPCPWNILSKVRLSGQLELEYLFYETYSLCCSCYDCGVISVNYQDKWKWNRGKNERIWPQKNWEHRLKVNEDAPEYAPFTILIPFLFQLHKVRLK